MSLRCAVLCGYDFEVSFGYLMKHSDGVFFDFGDGKHRLDA